jgi:PhzF family phenazine biosynthesis protein
VILYFVVHSFTDRVFAGNPAGVCPLEEWIDDASMQEIAAENRLSETAFFVRAGDSYRLRWFTPKSEVDLCGHATLASAFVLFDHLGHEGDTITFNTLSGELSVWKDGESLVMDFPSRPAQEVETPDHLVAGLRSEVERVLKSRDYMAVFENERQVRDLKPDFSELEMLDCTGIIATAPGDEVDFVSRFFAPREGIPEDPVTGSAHCTLTPYWAGLLGRNELVARQVSSRGGDLRCKLIDDRVLIAGRAALYSRGFLVLG